MKKDLFIFVAAGLTASPPACLPPTLCRINFYDVLLTSAAKFVSEEVILNEDRTTEEERRYIMEARKRALQKRKKLRTLGKSRSTESEDEEMEEEEGETFSGNLTFKSSLPIYFLGRASGREVAKQLESEGKG